MSDKALIPIERIERTVRRLRGHNVMLDGDLAALYQVDVKVLNQAVKRNLERFPEDFMFRLTVQEAQVLRSQVVTSKTGRGGRALFQNDPPGCPQPACLPKPKRRQEGARVWRLAET